MTYGESPGNGFTFDSFDVLYWQLTVLKINFYLFMEVLYLIQNFHDLLKFQAKKFLYFYNKSANLKLLFLTVFEKNNR